MYNTCVSYTVTIYIIIAIIYKRAKRIISHLLFKQSSDNVRLITAKSSVTPCSEFIFLIASVYRVVIGQAGGMMMSVSHLHYFILVGRKSIPRRRIRCVCAPCACVQLIA